MAQNTENKIFISHASEDERLAQEFSGWLEFILGIDTFLAGRNIAAGTDWKSVMLEALNQCNLGVVLITHNSSSHDWIHYEAGAMAVRNIPLIPVCFWTSKKGSLPSTLNSQQAFEWAEEKDRRKLVTDICKHLDVKAPLLSNEPRRRHIDEPDFGIADMPYYVRYGLSNAFWVPSEPFRRNERFLDAVKESDPAEPFLLVASSGGSYLKDTGSARDNGFDAHINEPGRSMKVVLQSPFCEFALARALACNANSHHWDREYRHSDLVNLADDDLFDIRVTSLPINGSFFITDKSVFFDPYIWGLPDNHQNVERNFWVFEFKKTDAKFDAHSLLRRHFDFLWSHSEPLTAYLNFREYTQKTDTFRLSLP